jgi:hypothetical protein
MSLNFNTAPYYDDFDESKKFYKILYRPGFAVQARELTQMQTILQNQVSRFGDHIFKEGAMVIPGQISVDTEIQYVKLESSFDGVSIDNIIEGLVGLTFKNSSGLVAEVIHITKASVGDPATLFVRYTNSGDDAVSKTFSDGDVLEDSNSLFSIQVAANAATGIGSIASIQQGVYYIKGHFVLVEPQTIVLEKYDNKPTFRIGLLSEEKIVTSGEDETLFDNAQNSFNFAAPGAHRYFIGTELTKLNIDSEEDTDFIELLRISDGRIKKQVRSTEYSILEETLARRTFDQAGNYTVKNFEIDVREYRNNDRGVWEPNRVYLLGDIVTSSGNIYIARNSGTSSSNTQPSHLTGVAFDGPGNTGIQWEFTENPFYNRGIFSPATTDILSTQLDAEAKLAVGLEPGKAYVQGYEIEKVSTEYVEVQKSRNFVQVDNAVIPVTVGNYVFVTNLNNLPPINQFGTITLYNRVTSTVGTAAGGNIVGTARARYIEWQNGIIGQQNTVYQLGLFDIKMNSGFDFNRDVKSFFVNNGGTTLNFTADVDNSRLVRLIGSVTASSQTVTGTGTSFQTDLKVNDYIVVGGNRRRVTEIGSQNSLTVDVSVTVTGVTIDRLETRILEAENNSLLFPLPYYAIKDVRSALLTNDTIYSVYERFTGSVTSGQISISTASGTFASAADQDNYIVVDNSTTPSEGGKVIAPISITPSGSGCTINVNTSLNGRSVIVIAAINKSGAILTEKTKTLVPSDPKEFTTKAEAQSPVLLLGKADGYRLVSVKMKPGTFASPGANFDIDITDRYEFDTGQRDTHYDIARLSLKSSFTPPEAPIRVVFDYFNHSNGDYFTVDSYPTNVDYKAIPLFNSIALRDSIDFRPKINDAGTGFTSTGASVSLIPKRGNDVIADFKYYLARRTKIAIDFSGNFYAIDGVSSLNPGEPLDPDLGLVLYSLALEPYTFGTNNNNVQVSRIDNKRYTMRDIGKLEKRIDNLEYYTSLSLLEQQTESLDIIDSFGESRFKNGFIVDNFAGHNTGDTLNPDYLCSIDMEKAELRPFFSMQNVNLLEKNSDNSQRNASKYKLYGDVVTLPVVEEVPIVSQPFASRLENINPFAVFTFLGDIALNPSSDDWFEVDRRPDLVIDVEGNFNTIKSLAEQAGVLGTVWNSWQNQWSGTPTVTNTRYQGLFGAAWGSNLRTGQVQLSPAEMNARFGQGPGAPGWARREVTVQTSATQIGQQRTGVRTTLVTKIDRQVVGDRLLASAAIPFIRSRNVLVQVQKLKPNTRFYPYFDNVSVQQYCTPASRIIYSPISGQFDTSTNAGGLASSPARRINGDSQVCLNRGDIITGSVSGATAVVVGTEFNSDTNTFSLYVLNVNGNFNNNENITGSISGSIGRVVSTTLRTQGQPIITNFAGDVFLLFNIPNTEAIRFRTGTREFKLIDNDVADGDFTSRGRANYHAEGVLETRQQTVHAVRNAELVEEQLSQNRVIVQTSSRVVADTGWYDPLAQTFLIEQRGGAFLSKVDVFFATKDQVIPVTVEIREVVNGYPGKRVLPFSRVTLRPNQVNLSREFVTLDGVSTPKYDTPTTFIFPSPVYVQENTEYAIVLSSDSNNYKVWISQVGDSIPGSTRTISEQPYLGSLFKSQNASTWTADQMQDLKFTLYRCRFDTSVIGNIEYVNDVLPLQRLDYDPFETRAGNNKVRVWHRDHGMPVGSKVSISGATGTLNNIPSEEFNTIHEISDVDLDSYVITVATSATSSGYVGGTEIRATRNMQFDAIQPSIQVQTFSETSVNFGIKTLSGKSVDGAQSPYVLENSFGGILANDNNYFSLPRMIASELNENEFIAGNKSITMNVTMNTTNDSLSPVLDTHRTSLIVINNKVNNPTEVNMNVGGLDDNVELQSNTTIAFSGSQITTANASARESLSSLAVGKFLNISGASNPSNNGTFLVIAVAADGSSVTLDKVFITETAGAAVTLTQRERFVDEIAPFESSTVSKYVTRRVNLANPSNFLRIRFAGNIPSGSNVEVYYKTSIAGSATEFDTINYTKVEPDRPIVNFSNFTDRFVDIDYSKDELDTFDAVQVKLVMKSTNSSDVPRIKDLRVIAAA